jgi:hypothetical protein
MKISTHNNIFLLLTFTLFTLCDLQLLSNNVNSTSSSSSTEKSNQEIILYSLSIATFCSSILSLLCSLIIIITFSFFQKYRKLCFNRLIFLMAFGDLLSSVGLSLGSHWSYSNVALCQIQGFLIQWGHLISLFWTVAMSSNLFIVLFYVKNSNDFLKLDLVYFTGCFGLSFIASFFPFFIKDRGGVYGPTLNYCWITDKWPELRLSLFYIPVWLIFIINLAIYIVSGFKLYHIYPVFKKPSKMDESSSSSTTSFEGKKREEEEKANHETSISSSIWKCYIQRTSLFIFAFIITWIIPSFNVINSLLTSQHPQLSTSNTLMNGDVENPNFGNFFLYLLQEITIGSRGFINCMCYFLMSWYSYLENKN